MSGVLKSITAFAAAAALLTSTTAIAAAPAPAPQRAPAKTALPQQPNPWLMLSALSTGAPRETVRPAAVQTLGAAQAAAVRQPSRPAGYVVGNPLLGGEVIVLGLWFGLIAVALSISGSSGANASGNGGPNSPT